MKLEEQVSSLDLSKKLKSLGVKQESLFSWSDNYDDAYELFYKPMHTQANVISAFTVAEIGEMLRVRTLNFPQPNIQAFQHMEGTKLIYSETEADARAKMLIYLIEQGIVKPEKESK